MFFSKHIISTIWIGSTGNKWNSSGHFPRIHYIGNSRRDSKDDGWIKVWTKAILLSTLEDSREHFGQFLVLDRRWYGTDLMSTNLMENDIKLLRTGCSTLPKANILYSVPPAHSKEENWKAKEMELNPFSSTVVMTPLNWCFEQQVPSISSGSTEQ